MDTLTHALSGALLARATAPRIPSDDTLSLRGRVAAGTAAAAAPDIDFVLGLVSPIVYLETHRGITHSLLLLPLWAFALAWLFARIARDRRGFAPWFGVCALGIATHIVGDLITSFGTMIFAPVSSARFGIGTTFINELWFTGLIVAGLAASLIWRRSRVPATAALFGLAAYVSLQAAVKHEIEQFGERYARSRGISHANVVAHPRPVSPFNWTVFVAQGEEIAFSHVNLVRRTPKLAPTAESAWIAKLDAFYQPIGDARWETRTRFGGSAHEQALARSAWASDALAVFRWFADIPAFDGLTSGSTCVWFRDLRFETPGRDAVPFRFGVCRDRPDGAWLLHMRGAGDAVRRVTD